MYEVSVIMSTYNGEKYLEEQIDSILSQKECEVKLFVRDDGSTDGTCDILSRYQEEDKLKYIKGENLKPAKSFLSALMQAEEADFYAFADQDDIWNDCKLLAAIEQLKLFDQALPNLYCANLTTVDSVGTVIKDGILPPKIVQDYHQILVRSPHIFGCTCVFNRTLKTIVCQKSLPQEILMHDLWLALIASGVGNLIYDPNAYIFYRQHGQNHTGTGKKIRETLYGRIRTILWGNMVSIADQAKELIDCVGEDILSINGKLDYTKCVANYKMSFLNKVEYLRTVDFSGMSIKQFLFHLILLFMNKL